MICRLLTVQHATHKKSIKRSCPAEFFVVWIYVIDCDRWIPLTFKIDQPRYRRSTVFVCSRLPYGTVRMYAEIEKIVRRRLQELRDKHADKKEFAEACMDLYFDTDLRDEVRASAWYQELNDKWQQDVWTYLEQQIDMLYYEFV